MTAMRIKAILLLVSILVVASVFPVLAQSNEMQDSKSKTILDELSAKTKAYTSIKAEFTVEMQSKDKTKKPDTQKGTLLLKGNKYKLIIKGQEIISDGKTTWTFLK